MGEYAKLGFERVKIGTAPGLPPGPELRTARLPPLLLPDKH
jgi:hypothetical protein